MVSTKTRDGLLEHGALLFARHGPANVTSRQLHEAIGARNESALNYHFGGRAGLVRAIVRAHLDAVEARRAPMVVAIAAQGREHDLRALVHALAAPLAEDLESPLGRAHLRLVAQVSHPVLAYEPALRYFDPPSRQAVLRWAGEALDPLPPPLRRERLATVWSQAASLFGLRAHLLDETPADVEVTSSELFYNNLIDLLVAGLSAPPSAETLAAAGADARTLNVHH